jgi:GTP-binding protein HflX
MRAMSLPSGAKAILSDTVGFVSNLPTELVAAFRATLEEVLEADVLLHVRDISHPDTDAQKRDVEQVLMGLFKSELLPENVIEVWNKADKIPPSLKGEGVYVSAITGEGLPELLEMMERDVQRRFYTTMHYRVPIADGKSMAWLHAHGKVVAQDVEDEYIQVTVQLSPDNAKRFERQPQVLT